MKLYEFCQICFPQKYCSNNHRLYLMFFSFSFPIWSVFYEKQFSLNINTRKKWTIFFNFFYKDPEDQWRTTITIDITYRYTSRCGFLQFTVNYLLLGMTLGMTTKYILSEHHHSWPHLKPSVLSLEMSVVVIVVELHCLHILFISGKHTVNFIYF